MKAVYTVEDLQLWSSFQIEPRIRFAVLGDPVEHSKSPQMHNAALKALGIPAAYCRIHVPPEQFPEAVALLPEMGFWGVNCTIPHKAAAMQLCSRLDPHASTLGVVNTIRIENQDLVGFNTDGPGLQRAVASELDADLASLRVLLLGAGGGAGRAIALQCLTSGCPSLFLANRTQEKSARLAAELRNRVLDLKQRPQAIEVVEWELDALADALRRSDLVINCTSVGMGLEDPSPLPAKILPNNLLIYDTIYTFHRTSLMRAGDQAGARSANGLGMLLHQGALAFEIWFNREAPLDVMRTALLAAAP